MTKKRMMACRVIAMGVLSAFLFVGVSSGKAQLRNGLIGYWPLNEGDGTTTANEAGGDDAELHNGVEWVEDPDRGTVLLFDGADGYVDAGAETIPQMTQDNDFTWSVWINQGGGNGPNNVVLGNRYSPGGGDFSPREFIKYTPTKFEFHLDGGGQNCEYEDLAGVEGEWVHYVVVKSGNTLTHYSNGEEGESSTFSGELQNPQPLYFGGDKTAENWSGMLDDVAIWDRALSADEVSALNSGGIPAGGKMEISEGLIGYWPFNDQASETKDLSSNGNNGTVNGDPEWVAGHSGAPGDSAIQFDGTDDSVTTGVSLLNELPELTLSFWMLMPEEQGGNRVGLIGQNDAVEYGMINPTTMQYWTPAGSINVDYGPTVADWTHVAVSVSEEGFKVYSAGELIGEVAGGGPVSSGDGFNMGGDGVYDAAGNWFTGSLDDVAVYNRALSADEIGALASGDAVPILTKTQLVPGMIAYWPFDGNLDDAVGDSHGEGQGGDPIEFAEGQFGEGIDLNGVDQFVQTPVENEEMFDFQDGTGFSVSAWFRVDGFTKSWQALIAKGEGNRWRVHRRGGESVLTGNGGNGDVPQGETAVDDEAIHHMVLVSDPENDEVRFYIDGELESSNTGPAIQSNDNPMMIGENPDARNRTWDGLIDDVGIWDRPITADEIATIWNGGEGTPLLTGAAATPTPRLSGLKGSAEGFSFQIKDVEGAEADPASIAVTYNGAAVEVTKSDKVDGIVTVSYTSSELLASESEHTMSVSLKDTNGNGVKIDKDFKVKAYTLVSGDLSVPASLKGESGILVYPTQISTGQGVGNLHNNQIVAAEKQVRGEFIDPDTEEQWLNEADFDAFEGWTWYPEIVEWVNQNQDAPGGVGNFQATGDGDAQDREDEPLTGIPGWGDSTDGIASEYIALLELEKGSYRFGVNSDDGFSATIGANFSDALGAQLGSFNGGRGASSTDFNFYISESGLYPYRVLWFEGGGGANIELYSYVDGEKVLINDPDVDGSVKAYSIKGAVVEESTTEKVSTGRPYIVSVDPSQGGVAKGGITVVAKNDSDSITKSSIKLLLNGEAVAADISTDGDTVTIAYDPEGGLPAGEHAATLSYDESNGKSRSISWSFSVPKFFNPSGPAPAEPLGLVSVTEWHGVGNGNMGGYNHAKYPDSPDFETMAGYFEWPQSGDPEVMPAGDVRNNYFWSIRGYFYPPETGEYRFYAATDDNSELWLSTDESPANARVIARETGWQPVRAYQAIGDETASSLILLEKGKPLYIELVSSEGGGGDNAALAVVLPSEEDRDVARGDTPVLGKYFSPFLMSVPDAVDLTITEQPTDASAEKNTTAQFSVGLSHDVGQVFWKLNGQVVGQGRVFTTPQLTDDHDGAKVQALVIYNGSQVSNEVTLTVTADVTAPAVIASDASRFLNTLSLTYSEDMDEASAGKASNYKVAGLSVDSVELNGRTVKLSTGDQTPGKVYTVSVSGVSDPAGNEFNGDVSIQAYVEATGFLWWDVWTGIGGAHPMENLTDNENYPDNPNFSQLMPWTNTRWATGFQNNANDNYGARMSGWLVAPETGEYRIWLRSDDHGQVWISTDEDPENAELIAEEVGCCKGFTLDDGGLSGIVELEKGQRYYFEALLKEGGGGDWMNVGWTRPNDEATSDDLDALDTPPWNDGGISGEHFVNYIPAQDPNPADIFSQGTGAPASGGGGLLVREFQGIGGSYLGDLFLNPKWPNSPDLVTYSNHAEWPQNASGDINDKPEGNVQDNYATQLLGFVHPPETGDYQFFVAADDRTVLYISSDESPTNKRVVAIEPQWNGVREFGQTRNRVVVDNDTGRQINGSAPISMEAGKAYYIEAITKEGGGGDNLAITWIRAGDDLPADGALPIAGEHLSPWIAPPAPVDNGDGTITFETHVAWEWWDGIGGAHPMENLTDNARYPNFPDGATWAPSWNTRTALEGGFEGNGRDNYGGRMSGILTAPETGTYRFFIASDDHGLLRISTDTDPANAVRVAEETGCCKNFTLDDGGLSGTVDLVEGQQYYMEALLKEGGGGDWMTVAWRKPSEGIDNVPAGNQEGIPGKYFAGTVKVPALPALSSSLSVSKGNSMKPNTGITLNVTNGATTLDAGSVAISIGGKALAATVTEGSWSKSFAGVKQEGLNYTITASTGDIEAGVEHTVSATFKDSAGAETAHDATFTIPVWELYGIGTKAPASAAGSISAREYTGVGGTSIPQLTSHASFPDSPGVEASAGYFEWPQSGDIDTKPEGNVQDNYGVQMIGFIHPPETGDYQFAIAADDNAELWLSTDESPANRQLIATEPQWNGVRAFGTGDRRSMVDAGTADERYQNVSKFISLEAGKAYYIEALMNEGGGGDNLAVAWTTADPIANDALPISGDFLSPWVPGGAGDGELPAPVSHWNFDDGQTVTDQAGANDGTVLKNVSFSTDTPDGSAHSIDLTGKDNYVRIGEESPGGPLFGIDETSSFTISAWVKYESSERGVVTVRQDLTSGGGDRSGMTLGINAKGNPFVGMIPCCDSSEFRDITTNQQVPTGTWTHLAATYDSDSDTLAVYVNGEAATGYTSNSAGSPADDGSNATGGIGGFDWTDKNGSFTGFGAAGNAPAHGSSAGDFTRLFYSGLLDEVAIWNKALNSDQIAGLAGAGAAAPGISVVNNGDGTVTVTFEGKLQAAPTVNGPWQDVDGASPLTIPSDQAQQFGRSVSE